MRPASPQVFPVTGSSAPVTAPASPDQARPRTGSYKIVKRGPRVTRARCLEGGNVALPTRGKAATAAGRDRAIRAACKSVDYTR